MWKNKHFVIALLVAPVLALIAYFATDYIVAERPHAAVAGSSYPLVAKSSCRYASGECELENGDVKLTLTADREKDSSATRLSLSSELALADAHVAVAESAGDQTEPVAFVADDDTATSWSVDIGVPSSADTRLQLVVMAGDSHYFAEVPTIFFDSETKGSR